MFSSIFLIPLVAGRSETTWIWGDVSGLDLEETLRILTIYGWPDLSFIRLVKYFDTLSIELVQKGTEWPESESFCSAMLPSAMREFIEIHDIDLKGEVSKIDVLNASDPNIAGCKCYVRLMVSMGYDVVEGQVLKSKSDIDQFCNAETPRSRMLNATPSNAHLVNPPPTDPVSDAMLMLADYTGNIYNEF